MGCISDRLTPLIYKSRLSWHFSHWQLLGWLVLVGMLSFRNPWCAGYVSDSEQCNRRTTACDHRSSTRGSSRVVCNGATSHDRLVWRTHTDWSQGERATQPPCIVAAEPGAPTDIEQSLCAEHGLERIEEVGEPLVELAVSGDTGEVARSIMARCPLDVPRMCQSRVETQL